MKTKKLLLGLGLLLMFGIIAYMTLRNFAGNLMDSLNTM